MNEVKLEYDGPQMDNFNPAEKAAESRPTSYRPTYQGQPGQLVEKNSHFELDLGHPNTEAISFSQYLVERESTEDKSGFDSKQFLAGILCLILAFLGVVHFTGESDDIVENLDSFVISLLGEEPQQIVANPVKNVRKTDQMIEEPKESISDQEKSPNKIIYNDDMFANPYWYLPNKLKPHPAPMINGVSGSDEQSFLDRINHDYVYQAYRAVKNLRKSRFLGTETILYEAVNHRKYWTRMEAVIALAEFGFEVSKETVAGVFEGVRPSLIKNYMKRLGVKTSPGELYILKQAIKLVDASGRLQVLKLLSRIHFRDSKLYLVAAIYDPSPIIQQWLESELEFHDVSGEEVKRYRETVAISYRDGKDLMENESEAVAISDVLEGEPPEDKNHFEYFVEEAKEVFSFDEETSDDDEGFIDEELELGPEDDGFDDIRGYMVEEGDVEEVEDVGKE